MHKNIKTIQPVLQITHNGEKVNIICLKYNNIHEQIKRSLPGMES